MSETPHPAPRATGSVVLFVVVAYALIWALALPAWLSGAGLDAPYLDLGLLLMMLAPSAAVVVAWLQSRRARRERGEPSGFRALARETGLTLGPDRRRTWRLIGLTWIAVPALSLLAGLLSAAVGLLPLDVFHLSGLVEAVGDDTVSRTPGGVGGVLVVTLLSTVVLATTLDVPFTLGEEWGWRGWLQPRLVERWGVRGGLVATGVVWGLWHAPVTLLGYNYPSLGPWAALWFLPFTVLAAIGLGWLRLATGSVWPSVVGHASINATAGLPFLLAPAGHVPNSAWAGLGGVVGWVLLVVAVVLLPRGPFRGADEARRTIAPVPAHRPACVAQ